MQRAVFLDRDGVLNRLVRRDAVETSPRTLAEFELLPGVRAAVEQLAAAGLLVIVATNQPDVARGALSVALLESMHARLRREVPLDAIYVCPHDDAQACSCRKPRAGLLERAACDWNLCLASSFLVGDSWRDIAAGRAAGCTTIRLAAAAPPAEEIAADVVVRDLPAAAELILSSLCQAGSVSRPVAARAAQC